jgi:hypothetical protein
MNTDKKVFEKLFSSEKVELSSDKYEFALADDFIAVFTKANNDQAKISTTLVDNLAKAANSYKGNIDDWSKASVIGSQLIARSKEIGIDLPPAIINRIKASDIEVKKMQSMIGKITQLYKEF